MTKPKFTPKPWFRKGKRVYWKNPDKDLPRGTLPNGLICICKSAKDWPECDEEVRANADLITAAPEMYEALEKIQEIELSIAQEHRVSADDSQIYNIAEKVLRKARGESEDDE